MKSCGTLGLRVWIGRVGVVAYPCACKLTEDLHKAEAPYQPDLQGDDDTRHFDVDIPNEVSLNLLQTPWAPKPVSVNTLENY